MEKITMKIEGMMCGMCESHINDAIRRSFSVKKVSASHSRGEAVILTEEEISEEKLRETIGDTGYTVLSIKKEPYEKKGFLDRFRK